MRDETPTSGRQYPERAPRATTGADWVFSAVIHLLLAMLLVASQAGGRGGTAGGTGEGDGLGDGWIEAQIGDESEWSAGSRFSFTEAATHIAIEPFALSPPTDGDAHIDPSRRQPDVQLVVAPVSYWQSAGDDPVSNTAEEPSAQAANKTGGAKRSEASQNRRIGRGTAGSGEGAGGIEPGRGGPGGTSMFGICDGGERIVYVIDRSSSMAQHGKLAAARRELAASLQQLGPEHQFQVLFYNQDVQPLRLDAAPGLLRASAVNKHRAVSQIRLVPAEGATRHQPALDAALRLKPSIVFFLTDAESGLTADETAVLAARASGRTRFHCIHFAEGPDEPPVESGWLQQLAAATGGEFRRLQVVALRTAVEIPD